MNLQCIDTTTMESHTDTQHYYTADYPNLSFIIPKYNTRGHEHNIVTNEYLHVYRHLDWFLIGLLNSATLIYYRCKTEIAYSLYMPNSYLGVYYSIM